MNDLSQEQRELKVSITKGALIWAVILGVIIALLAYWLLGSQGTPVRIGGGVILGGIMAFFVRQKIFNSRSATAKCAKCSAVFSITRTDKKQTLVSSEEKSEHEKLEGGGSKLKEWTEEKYDVVDTYTCSACGDEIAKEYQKTVRKDEIIREKGTVKKAKASRE